MDLIDFRRVPESGGQTHYFSNGRPSLPSSKHLSLLPPLLHRYVFRGGAVAS